MNDVRTSVVPQDELYISEDDGTEERHWIFKLKGRSRKCSLDRYWARKRSEDGSVSTGWYRANIKSRPLELKDVPRPKRYDELVEWCKLHECDVPRLARPPVAAKPEKPTKQPKAPPRGRGRPAGTFVKGSISDKIRKSLLRNPGLASTELTKKYGISRQLISQIRTSLKEEE